jgi:catechol 2,3-dioxygenase-like lactoylglutathione lyase family enzyme
MIHHISVGTNDVSRARRFYDPVMQLLGLRLLKSGNKAAHYGVGDILFSLESPVDGQSASPGNGVHIAFQARDHAMVDEFHATGLRAGGSDAGAPGLRTQYDANYYGAFLRDPDGNKIEAVTFAAK